MTLELYVKSRKEGQKHGFDYSLEKLSIKSSLANHVTEPIFKVRCKFWDLFQPLML